MQINSPSQWIRGQSLASGFTSTHRRVTQCLNYAVHCSVTNAAGLAGTLKIRGRVRDEGDTNPLPWVDLDNGSAAISANGGVMFNVGQCGYDEVAITWTNTSGTGTLDVNFRKKAQSA